MQTVECLTFPASSALLWFTGRARGYRFTSCFLLLGSYVWRSLSKVLNLRWCIVGLLSFVLAHTLDNCGSLLPGVWL
ncbi:hypothetical protein CesoFtcFv8_004771 [Champsocephalus esox]|uniref:Uncharacterized protein n=1 Tax=Champsocephalus esox TaxID=159716 RepID=A0AAN8CN36_9TELE|nr:hypothetical protein CesoFtcFv8_004771 [Champsocephalus esox]